MKALFSAAALFLAAQSLYDEPATANEVNRGQGANQWFTQKQVFVGVGGLVLVILMLTVITVWIAPRWPAPEAKEEDPKKGGGEP